jgi:hypothetical protein
MARINLVPLICLVGAASASAAEPPAEANKAPLSATAGPAVNVGADKAPAAKPPVAQSPAAATKPATGNPKTPAAASKAPAKPAAAGAKTNDRLALDTTVVTGNRELPKVLYIVPWKKADIGELPAQPFNTLLDEVLTPVDRDVFRREVTYYGAISGSAAPQGNGSATGSTAPGPQPPGSEK